MMYYEMFKNVAEEKFLSFMPESYQDMEVRVKSVNKINQKKDGLYLVRRDGEKNTFPTIYINDIYDDYLKTGDLQGALQNAAEAMDRAFKEIPIPKMYISTAKDSIIFQLVNTAQNEEMLSKMPHREFQDLSIIYRWVADVADGGMASAAVNNYLAGELGMDEEQLFKAAVENTRRILPPVIKPMDQVICEMLLSDGMPQEMVDTITGGMPANQTMWVISNQSRVNGASSMLYEDQLHELAERIGNDLYILPSSVHEVIAVSTVMGGPEELAQIVNEINMDQVELDERLSNQVYHYDKDLRQITLATDTPNKRLDGAAEQYAHEPKQSR